MNLTLSRQAKCWRLQKSRFLRNAEYPSASLLDPLRASCPSVTSIGLWHRLPRYLFFSCYAGLNDLFRRAKKISNSTGEHDPVCHVQLQELRAILRIDEIVLAHRTASLYPRAFANKALHYVGGCVASNEPRKWVAESVGISAISCPLLLYSKNCVWFFRLHLVMVFRDKKKDISVPLHGATKGIYMCSVISNEAKPRLRCCSFELLTRGGAFHPALHNPPHRDLWDLVLYCVRISRPFALSFSQAQNWKPGVERVLGSQAYFMLWYSGNLWLSLPMLRHTLGHCKQTKYCNTALLLKL